MEAQQELIALLGNVRADMEALRSVTFPNTFRASAALRDDINELHDLYDISDLRGAIVSHRPILGPAIVFCKRLIRFVGHYFLKICLYRQIRFNELMVSVCYKVAALEMRLQRMEKMLAKVAGDPHVSKD